MNNSNLKAAHFKIFLFLFLFFNSTFARNIYVSTTGSDDIPNDGSVDLPYLTINKAAQVAVFGDVVIIKSGTYFPTSSIIIANSGTSVAPITFRSEVPDGVIIDGTNSSTPNATDRRGIFTILGTKTVTKNWIILDGLKIINSKFAGIYSKYADNIIVKNCSTYNTGASGIVAANSSNIKVLNNKVQLACMYPDTAIGTNECITMASVNTFEVAHNIVLDRPTDPSNGGEGIDVKNNSINGTIHHNTISNLYRVGIYIDAYTGNLTNIEVYANKIYNSKGGGITIANEEGGVVNGVKVHDNVIYDIDKFGIRIAGYLDNGPITNLDIYQNTIVSCGWNAGNWENVGLLLEATNNLNSGFNIINNVISNCPIQMRANGQTFPYVLNNNLLFGPTAVAGTNVISGNPLFVNLAEKDFRLSSLSPAINNAVSAPQSIADFNDYPRDSQSDLGAFEFGSALSTADFETGLTGYLLYPNPCNDILNIDLSPDMPESIFVKIIDFQGRVLINKDMNQDFNSKNTIALPVSSLKKDKYIISLYGKENKIIDSKIFIKE